MVSTFTVALASKNEERKIMNIVGGLERVIFFILPYCKGSWTNDIFNEIERYVALYISLWFVNYFVLWFSFLFKCRFDFIRFFKSWWLGFRSSGIDETTRTMQSHVPPTICTKAVGEIETIVSYSYWRWIHKRCAKNIS